LCRASATGEAIEERLVDSGVGKTSAACMVPVRTSFRQARAALSWLCHGPYLAAYKLAKTLAVVRRSIESSAFPVYPSKYTGFAQNDAHVAKVPVNEILASTSD
jgi:hypothetical protein